MNKPMLSLAGLTCLIALSTADAQLPVSREAGIFADTIAANQFKLFSIPFTQEPVARGVVTSATANTVTLSGVSGLNSLAGTHTLVIASSVNGNGNDGRYYQIASFPATDQATITGTLPALTLNADEVLIVPNFTLNTAFPAGGSFKKGANPGSADVIYSPVGAALRSFYFNTTNNRWQFADSATVTTDQGGVVIDYNGGVLVRGASASPGSFLASGIVRSGDVKQEYNNTNFRIVSMRNNAATTLLNSELTAAVVKGAGPGAADVVYAPLGGALRSFYFNNVNNRWQFADSATVTTDQGSLVTIPAGGAVMLRPVGTSLRTIAFQEAFAQ